MTATAVPRIRALECPNCGGTVELRGHAHTINAVCIQCLSVIDTRTPDLQILQRASAQQRFMPLIPLGTRGRLSDTTVEMIGFQVREIVVEGLAYRWSEYLAYNPFRGYWYITEYQGHWNVIRTVRSLPQPATSGSKKAARYAGRLYTHFQSASAKAIFVMGEFPWQIRVGDTVTVEDYVSPPHVLSAEVTPDEAVWSAGTYTRGKDIWRAFDLKGSPPSPQGVYANQPSPYAGRVRTVWKTFSVLAVLFLLLVSGLAVVGRGQEVFRSRYSFATNSSGEPAFVTPIFDVPKEGNVQITVDTDLSNDWAFFGIALINDETGVAYDFGEEVSYYYGRDSDGDWTEGQRAKDEVIPSVPAGRYYLRIEPDMENDARRHTVNYEVTVRTGVLRWFWLVAAFFLLPLPAIWTTWRSVHFENARWSESDYGPLFSSLSSEED